MGHPRDWMTGTRNDKSGCGFVGSKFKPLHQALSHLIWLVGWSLSLPWIVAIPSNPGSITPHNIQTTIVHHCYPHSIVLIHPDSIFWWWTPHEITQWTGCPPGHRAGKCTRGCWLATPRAVPGRDVPQAVAVAGDVTRRLGSRTYVDLM